MNESAVKFIAAPYEPGVSVREDIACNYLKIVAYGRMAYMEDDWRLGHYYLDGCLEVSGISDITSAVLLAEYLYKNDAWECRDAEDVYSNINGEDDGPTSFYFQYLEIIDRHGKRVMSASHCYKKQGLQWEVSIVSERRKNAAIAEMKKLADQASEERRGDNYDSARWFDLKSDKLLARVVTSGYNRQAIMDELEQSSSMKPQALSVRLLMALAKSSLTSDRLPF
ncbi:hypothetical protein BvCmsC16A_04158 [Escherichia coli]|uniref:hypothetical protein n=1 Tax=Escherichia coli TaxID=562 RepID=UPI0010BC824C|nr:hypothetical protein [Escherichia coli]GCK64170.1 hypothetical protein BvCmsC16A_04158 [Escherichia coli]